jgi:hypothetical protein
MIATERPRPDPGETRRFLAHYAQALEARPDARFANFILPDRRTIASRSTDAIADSAVYWSARGREVYGHTHLHELPEGVGSHRGSVATVRVAIGIPADIDAVGPGRKKDPTTLCPTVSDAIWLAETFDCQCPSLRISMLIGSGYGVYPVILFKEPFIVATVEDRLLLESLSRRFHGVLHDIASQRGWTGAVEFADVAKVLRLPGTLNYKDPAHPKCVRVLYENGARFTIRDLDDLLPPEPSKIKEQSKVKEPRKNSAYVAQGSQNQFPIVVNPNANPRRDMLELMMELDPLFKATWFHKRKLKDTSQSGFDLSIASRAANVGWSDQGIVDLMIANRRLFGGEPKRPDYYWRTLAAAKASAKRGGLHG